MNATLTTLLSIVVTVGAIALGAWGGGTLGQRARGRSGRYWLLNAAVVLIGFLLSFLAAIVALPYLSFAAIGFMGGGITGLKYGYGRSEGIWKTHDVWMRSDADLIEPDKRDAPEGEDRFESNELESSKGKESR